MALDRDFSWRRSIAWAVALGVHAALLVLLTRPLAFERPVEVSVIEPPAWIEVDWVPMPPERVVREAEIVPRRPSSTLPPARPRPQPVTDVEAAIVLVDPPTVAPAAIDPRVEVPVARAILFVDDEVRAVLPDEPIYASKPPAREGDYYTPGNGTEDDIFYRPLALEPDPSRFAYAWKPKGNLLDEWLGRLMEATSGKVSVPLNAKFSLVCGGSIVGVAGGCMIVRNGGTGVIVQRPPPAPWERSNRVQCRELAEQLEAAEEVERIAFLLDRLSSLCSGNNDEARRGAGLRGDALGEASGR